MKIATLNDVKKSINFTVFIALVVTFLLSSFTLYFLYCKYEQKRAKLAFQRANESFVAYQSRLSEKVSVIASSQIFLDFIHSGKTTQQVLLPDFLGQLMTLNKLGVVGVNIRDTDVRGTIQHINFSYGQKTTDNMTLLLSYLGSSLNTQVGRYKYTLTLYFNKSNLIELLVKTNDGLKKCDDCAPLNMIQGKMIGSLPLINKSGLKLNLIVIQASDWQFLYNELLLTLVLFAFAFWNRHRIRKLVFNYIHVPILNLNNAVKNESLLTQGEYVLDEIKYLANELDNWQRKSKEASALTRQAEIGKLASQVAHDIRSPLSALQMTVDNLTRIPENHRNIIKQAALRINAIANNLLMLYRNNKNVHSLIYNNQCSELLSDTINLIVLEKRAQYFGQKIHIIANVTEESKIIIAHIDTFQFKSVLSNLLNNAIESHATKVEVTTKTSQNNDFLEIHIKDNGCGMSEEMLTKIIDHGLSNKESGTGLGLSHAIKNINIWGGRYKIQSQVEVGTLFLIYLPLFHKADMSFTARTK